MISSHCSQPYTTRWLKSKLLEKFKDTILICSKHGQEDIVLFYESAGKLLTDFKARNDENDDKYKYFELAGKLLVNDIIAMDYGRGVYFKPCLDTLIQLFCAGNLTLLCR